MVRALVQYLVRIALSRKIFGRLLVILFCWLLFYIFVWTVLNDSDLYAIPEDDAHFDEYVLLKAARKNDGDLISAVEELKNNRKASKPLSYRAKQILVNESCSFSDEELRNFPHCLNKIMWMKKGWKSDVCYSQKGVDGSLCSFMVYLSEVETHCPVLEWRRSAVSKTPAPPVAQVQKNYSVLFELMKDSEVNYEFIKTRIRRLWSKWLEAYEDVEARWPKTLFNRRRLNIIVHMGFLSKETGFKFGEKSGSGGPLGELVQWSDLIATLHILGHRLLISTEFATFKSNVKMLFTDSPCATPSDRKVDIIFTDIVGVRYMRRNMKVFFAKSKCLLRVLDSFGTHAEFNLQSYFAAHKVDLGGRINPWGGNGLDLQQFMTMYPHTDDNTFLGFLVEMHAVDESAVRDNATLVYGKEIYMWKDADALLELVGKHTKLHATVADVKEIKNHSVWNHGLLSGFELHSLLRRVKIFLGLGFPLEGPAPLEAVASGAVFINPLFRPPKSRKTYKFFAEKPTLRELTSQNPYMENFIGEPRVLTVDISNLTEVELAIKKALGSKPSPFLPFEFTASGMLQRVNTLINKQNFCSEVQYPPLSVAKIIYADAGQSCQQACASQGLVCERSFFSLANQSLYADDRLKRCAASEISLIPSPLAPYDCYRQKERLLFSCASTPARKDVRRICPCRDFLQSQIALCSLCL